MKMSGADASPAADAPQIDKSAVKNKEKELIGKIK